MTDPEHFDPMAVLHRAGIRSRHAYAAGLASVLLAAGTWLSARYGGGRHHRSVHRGIFIGEWAPTFFAIGLALRDEEHHCAHRTHGQRHCDHCHHRHHQDTEQAESQPVGASN